MNATISTTTDCHHPESVLLHRLRAGDETAYSQFVRQYGDRMMSVSYRFLHCEADCADAVQDAFISAFRSLDRFEEGSSLGTWLHRIVVNACLMKLRSRASRRTASLEELLPVFDATGHHVRPIQPWGEQAHTRLQREETRTQVRECIGQLPDPYRTVLLLRDIEEMDTEETAQMLGISPGAVKTRLHRARQALRTLLEPVVLNDTMLD